MCLHNWWNWRVDPDSNVNKILYCGFVCNWFVTLLLFVRTLVGCWIDDDGVAVDDDDDDALLLVLAAWFVDALLLCSFRISTLKRTLRAKNLSGDLYSQRNKLGLFMLCIKSWV